MRKQKTSFQLSAEDKELLRRLAKHFGVSQAAVFSLGIRVLAKQEGITEPPHTKKSRTEPASK